MDHTALRPSISQVMVVIHSHHVRGMIYACRPVVFVMRVMKPQLYEQMARRFIFWIVSREKAGYAELFKGVFHDSLRSFKRETTSPVF